MAIPVGGTRVHQEPQRRKGKDEKRKEEEESKIGKERKNQGKERKKSREEEDMKVWGRIEGKRVKGWGEEDSQGGRIILREYRRGEGRKGR